MPIKYFMLACLAFASFSVMAQQEKKLSLTDALVKAVESNLDVQLQRVALDDKAISLDETRARYEPSVTSSLQRQNLDQQVSNTTEGESGATFSIESWSWNSSLRKTEDFGLSWTASFNNSLDDNGSALSLGETYNSTMSFFAEQKILKGFALDKEIRLSDEYIARGNLALSEKDLEIAVTNVLQTTENAYWDLVLAIEDLKVKQQSLRLAQKLYDQNKVKVEVGTLASIELVNTEATIATRETEIVTAENNVLAAEDRLKRVLNLPADEWTDNITPTDALEIKEISTDFKKDLTVAYENRPEMHKNLLELENAALTRKLRKNELKPELNLTVGYFSRGISSPITPTITSTDENGNPIRIPVGDTISSSYHTALSSVMAQDLPGLQTTLDFTWTPFNKQAKVNLAKANAAIRQTELNAEKVKLDIMESVRTAGRELQSNLKSIKANEKSLKFQKENLKAEVQKYQNGLSTNYLVSEAQNNVSQAESSLNSAKINYLKAQVEYYKALGLLAEKRKINVK